MLSSIGRFRLRVSARVAVCGETPKRVDSVHMFASGSLAAAVNSCSGMRRLETKMFACVSTAGFTEQRNTPQEVPPPQYHVLAPQGG